MMTLWTQARIALVASVGLFLPFAVALAQDDADSSNGLETPPPEETPGTTQDQDAGGFWGWIEKNIEYPDSQSEENQRRGNGGGGDSGGGGGHGG